MNPKMLLLALFQLLFIATMSAQEGIEVDEMPYFPGCESFKKGSLEKRNCSNVSVVSFISNYLEYPESAKKEQFEGTVLVNFEVQSNGKVTKPTVLNDIGGGCGDAALEVIKKMPDWEPATHAGKRVSVRLTVPVFFSLGNSTEQKGQLYKVGWGLLKGNSISKQQLLENMNRSIQVRDAFGNIQPFAEILLVIEKGNRLRQGSSNGSWTKRQKRMVKHIKKGSLLTIIATVQEKGEFIYVEQGYNIH